MARNPDAVAWQMALGWTSMAGRISFSQKGRFTRLKTSKDLSHIPARSIHACSELQRPRRRYRRKYARCSMRMTFHGGRAGSTIRGMTRGELTIEEG